MSCIDMDVLLKWELGELSLNEAERAQRHLTGCSSCRLRRERQRQMLEDLRPAAGAAADPAEFVGQVMAACDASPALARSPSPWSRRAVYLPAAVAALAAAAGTASWMGQWPEERLDGRVTARGPGVLDRPSPILQAFAGRAGGSGPPALLEGAELGPGDGILVRYSNLGDREAFLMVFAIDGAGEVHWIHPAYLHADSNPESIRLARRVENRVLDEIAEPENPAPGPLRVFALVTEAPLNVKQVEESLAHGGRSVPERFPEAVVEEWRCSWRLR